MSQLVGRLHHHVLAQPQQPGAEALGVRDLELDHDATVVVSLDDPILPDLLDEARCSHRVGSHPRGHDCPRAPDLPGRKRRHPRVPIRARVLGDTQASHVPIDAVEPVEALVIAVEIEP